MTDPREQVIDAALHTLLVILDHNAMPSVSKLTDATADHPATKLQIRADTGAATKQRQ